MVRTFFFLQNGALKSVGSRNRLICLQQEGLLGCLWRVVVWRAVLVPPANCLRNLYPQWTFGGIPSPEPVKSLLADFKQENSALKPGPWAVEAEAGFIFQLVVKVTGL